MGHQDHDDPRERESEYYSLVIRELCSIRETQCATLNLLAQIEGAVKIIMATEKEVADALVKIDAATSRAAANIQILADTDQKISDEVDALVAALKAAGVSQALVDQASALAAKSQAVSDSLDTMVPALQAIAAKGVTNPVPVPVPAAPPTP